MNTWFDTEFMDTGGGYLHLISIGLIKENGEPLYCQNADFDRSVADAWVRKNVLRQLDTTSYCTKAEMREKIIDYIGEDTPRFWGYFADYDWVLLTGIFGGMLRMPSGWPQLCLDIKQSAIERGNIALPVQTSPEHHALNDAIWTRDAYRFLHNIRMMP